MSLSESQKWHANTWLYHSPCTHATETCYMWPTTFVIIRQSTQNHATTKQPLCRERDNGIASPQQRLGICVHGRPLWSTQHFLPKSEGKPPGKTQLSPHCHLTLAHFGTEETRLHPKGGWSCPPLWLQDPASAPKEGCSCVLLGTSIVVLLLKLVKLLHAARQTPPLPFLGIFGHLLSQPISCALPSCYFQRWPLTMLRESASPWCAPWTIDPSTAPSATAFLKVTVLHLSC